MKILKRIAIAFVFCLAVVGAYTLLKKAPQLNVPAEDLSYLQGVGISASESASDEGLSGVHGDVVGVPSLVATTAISNSTQGSSAPPSSFGTPTFNSVNTNTNSIAPPFAEASSEAPAFIAAAPSVPLPAPLPVSTASTEAPAFIPAFASTEAPAFIPTPAPAFASTEAPPFVPATPAATIAAPFIPPVITPTPVATPAIKPAPVQSPLSPPLLSPLPPVSPTPPPPQPPSFESPPLAWDGPSTEVIFIPSMSPANSWGDSGILETKSEPQPNPMPNPEPALLESIPLEPTPLFSATIPVSAPAPAPEAMPMIDPFSTTAAQPIDPETIPVPALNPTPHPVLNPVPSAVPVPNEIIRVADKGTGTENRIRRIPTREDDFVKASVNEKKKTLLVTSLPITPNPVRIAPTESPKPLYQESSQVKEENNSPHRKNDYQQTSIRKDSLFTPTRQGINEAKPVISFSQQKPTVRESLPAIPATTPTATQPALPVPQQKKAVPTEMETIPFAKMDITSEPFSSAAYTAENSARTPGVKESVERFIKAQALLVESGDTTRIRNAFVQLSKLYENPELNDAEKAYMTPLLDRMALNVIYSRNSHVLEPPYTVKQGDSIDSIAKSLEISPALLMKINGLTGARPLEPGTDLKIVVGHFDARISVKHRELTLILGGLYAGRFPLALGERVENLRGEFYISSKTDTWNEKSITLNNGVTFYGLLDDRLQPDDPQPTTVRFTRQDAKELFDILIERSVIIFED